MNKLTNTKTVRTLAGIIMLVAWSQVMAGSSAKESVEQVIKHYGVSLNASDTKSVMKMYAKDPIFMPQHSDAQVGRTAVKKAYESVFKTIDLNIEFTIYEIEVYGDTAWARTSSAGKTIILKNKMEIDEGNNELFIFKKESGTWKIHRYLFSTTTPRH